MLYTVSSRYRKAKVVCSHSRLFLSQGRPQRSVQGCYYKSVYGWSGPEGTGGMSVFSIAHRCPTTKFQELGLEIGAGTVTSQQGQIYSLKEMRLDRKSVV